MRGTIRRAAFLAAAASVAIWPAACGAPVEAPLPGGVVVTGVEPGGAAARAGLRAGDRLLTWSRFTGGGDAGPGGRLTSPIELARVEELEAPVGKIRLGGWREGATFEATLPPASWRLEARPGLDGGALGDYLAGLEHVEAERLDAGVAAWRALAEGLEASGRIREAVWLRGRTSVALGRAGRAEAAAEEHAAALALAAEDADARAWLWRRRGEEAAPPEAAEAYRRALEEPGMPEARRAGLLLLSALATYRQGSSDAAEDAGRRSKTAWSRLAPGGLGDVRAAVLLAKISRNRGRLEAAASELQAALSAAAELDPGSRLEAEVASELGIALQNRGDLATAQELQSHALTIFRDLGVDDETLGRALMGSGIIAWNRGALDQAQLAFLDALEVFEREVPGTAFEAWSLQGLGVVALERGDHGSAEGFLRRCLALHRSSDRSLEIAQTLSNLAAVAHARSDDEGAVAANEAALALFEEILPEGRNTARVLGNLGDLRARAGEIELARRLQDRALAWFEEHAPGSTTHAYQLVQRGLLELEQGRLGVAEGFLLRALRIRRRLAPGSGQEATSLYALGRLRRAEGNVPEARALFEEALAALETQKGRLGGSKDAAAAFSARFAPIYKDLVQLLLELGETEEAFEILERYRAQGLLAMLGARDLALSAEIPEQLARRERELARAYEQAQSELAGLDASAAPGSREILVARLGTLKERRASLIAEITEAAPRYGDLALSRPLSVAGAADALDPGTLLLSYAVLPERTVLFVLDAGDPESLEAITLLAGAAELERRVESWLYLIRSPRARQAGPGLSRRAAELHRLLVAPAAARIARAERVLIVPDGPLHALPFAALEARAGDRPGEYLLASAPLHTAVSATTYGQLARGRRDAAPGTSRLVAFGDPSYRPVARAEVSAADLRSRTLAPLPASRAEVEALARLFPETETYLGEAASEERAKALDGSARYLHFACHSAVDHRFPLDSYLALSLPDAEGLESAENGYLQAWEIFEQVRLDAELVTLSACETGLGQAAGGDGLVGLTRAFQYAGARSVVASLWGVSDLSTSALMARFYRYLRAGASKDAALRSAQLDLLRGPVALPRSGPPWWLRPAEVFASFFDLAGPDETVIDATHPYYWAAFQLHGDWR